MRFPGCVLALLLVALAGWGPPVADSRSEISLKSFGLDVKLPRMPRWVRIHELKPSVLCRWLGTGGPRSTMQISYGPTDGQSLEALVDRLTAVPAAGVTERTVIDGQPGVFIDVTVPDGALVARRMYVTVHAGLLYLVEYASESEDEPPKLFDELCRGLTFTRPCPPSEALDPARSISVLRSNLVIRLPEPFRNLATSQPERRMKLVVHDLSNELVQEAHLTIGRLDTGQPVDLGRLAEASAQQYARQYGLERPPACRELKSDPPVFALEAFSATGEQASTQVVFAAVDETTVAVMSFEVMNRLPPEVRRRYLASIETIARSARRITPPTGS